MRKIMIVCAFALVGCSEKNAPKAEPSEAAEIVPYVKKNYTESDPSAQLNFVQLAQIAINSLPAAQATYNQDATEVKFVPKGAQENSTFIPFHDWYSIKIIRKSDSENWDNFLVEVFNKQGYEQSKIAAFNACKDVWKNIDNRLPLAIDELSQNVNDYEKQNSKAATQQMRYGYWINLDASHYKEGYPIVCQIAVSK